MPTTYTVQRSNEEIDEALDICVASEADGRRHYPAMTYEQGVKAALEWLLGETDEPPFDQMADQ